MKTSDTYELTVLLAFPVLEIYNTLIGRIILHILSIYPQERGKWAKLITRALHKWHQAAIPLAFGGRDTTIRERSNIMELPKRLFIPAHQRKRVGLSRNIYYDVLEIYENRITGYFNEQAMMTWYFSEYSGIDIVQAGWYSQFAQIIFLAENNPKKRTEVGLLRNAYAIEATDRILFCAGTFSFRQTNEFALTISSEIESALDNYHASSNKK